MGINNELLWEPFFFRYVFVGVDSLRGTRVTNTGFLLDQNVERVLTEYIRFLVSRRILKYRESTYFHRQKFGIL